MADRVVIDGLAGGVEKWATEKSLSELVTVFKKYADLNQKDLKTLSKSITDDGKDKAADNEDVLAVLQKIKASNESASKSQAKTVKAAKSKNKGSGKTIGKLKSNLVDDAFGGAHKNIKPFTDSVAESVKNLDSFSAAIVSSTVSIAKKFFSSGKSLIGSNIDIYKSGINVSNMQHTASGRMAEFSDSMVRSNMTMDQLSSVVKQNAKVINTVGIRAFTDAASEVEKTGKAFGLTALESADFLASHIEQQRISGMLDDISSKKARGRAIANLKTTTLFAQALGKSTKDIQDAAALEAQNVNAQAALSGLPAATQDAMRASLSTMNEGMKQVVLGMLQAPEGLEHGSQAAMDAMQRGLDVTPMLEFVQSIKSGALAGQNVAKASGSMMMSYANSVKQNRDLLKVMAVAGDTVAMEHLGNAEIMHAQGKLLQNASLRTDGLAESQARLATVSDNLASIFDDILGKTLLGSVDSLDGIVKSINGILGDDFVSSIKGISTGLSNGLSPIFSAFTENVGDVTSFIGKLLNSDVNMTWGDKMAAVGKIMTNEWTLATLHLKFGFMNFIKGTLMRIKDIFGGGGLISSFLGKITGIFKPLFKLFTKIPFIGSVIGGVFGMIEEIGNAINAGQGIGGILISAIQGAFMGVVDAFVSLPKLLLKGAGNLILGKEFGQSIDKNYEKGKDWFKSLNPFKSDKPKEEMTPQVGQTSTSSYKDNYKYEPTSVQPDKKPRTKDNKAKEEERIAKVEDTTSLERKSSEPSTASRVSERIASISEKQLSMQGDMIMQNNEMIRLLRAVAASNKGMMS